MKTQLFMVLFLVAQTAIWGQATWYVDVNPPMPSNLGTSWTEAFNNMDLAILSASEGDTILIRQGIYKEHIELHKGLHIFGGFNGTESFTHEANPELYPTIFDADILGNDIAGNFTSNKGDNLTYIATLQGSQNFSASITGITFKNTYSFSAIHFKNQYASTTQVLKVKSCKFFDNCSNFQDYGGGAVYVAATATGAEAKLYVDKCIFKGNGTTGSFNVRGSAAYIFSSSNGAAFARFTNNLFDSNTDAAPFGNPCVISQMVSSFGGSQNNTTAQIVNNTFVNNNGVAVWYWNGSSAGSAYSEFFNNIVNGGSLQVGDIATIDNSYGVETQYNLWSTTPVCDIPGALAEFANIVSNTPGFTDAANGDYSIQPASDAHDSGDPNTVNYAFLPDNLDLAGGFRIMGQAIDIGAYEYHEGVCMITGVSIDSVTACTPATNTYSVFLTVSYTNPPLLGDLDVNGTLISFSPSSTQSTVTLNNLPANGNMINLLAFFTSNSDCGYLQSAAWQAPLSCIGAGIDSETAGTLKLYPNPAGSYINIDINQSTEIWIYNSWGMMVGNRMISAGTSILAVDDLPPGIYAIRTLNGMSRQFIKE